jgi:general secretion pathway protein D
MTSSPGSRSRRGASRALLVVLTLVVSACASSGALRTGERAERERDYDQAVIIYTRALQERPRDRNLQLALERARLRAAQMHYAEGRRLERDARWADAAAEYQVAYDLNPGMADIERALRGAEEAMRAELAAATEGRTALEALIDSSFDAAPPGLDLPRDIALPDSVVFASESARAVFAALGQLTGFSIVFDAQFRDTPFSGDLREMTFDTALAVVATSTGNFFRVTAPGTVTIIPDTPAKRREYEEEIVRTFYLSNADIRETIDLLRLVVDLRRLAPVTATNAISIKDTPERIDAAAQLIRAIDKARAEVVIEVQLLEVDRQALRDYGLRFISSGDNSEIGAGESATRDIDSDNPATGLGLSVDDLRRVSGSNLFVANPSSLLLRLLQTNGNTRILANPQLRTSDGVEAEAHFGERVPVPVTTFTPFAAGGISQQPITSFNYEEIGVNILITPRVHHNDEVSLSVEVGISNISGTGFGDLPQFGSRSITTRIRLRDGETNILAGLIRDEERETREGIPGLSGIPILGRLFGRTRTDSQETDIVLTLRPHIIRPLALDEDDLRPFRVGTTPAAAAPGGGAQPASSRTQPLPQPRSRPGGARFGTTGTQQPITAPVDPPAR